MTLEAIVQTFLGSHPRRMVCIGGLPRSGTSSCEAFLHAQDGCFAFDEFHPLLWPRYQTLLLQLDRYGRSLTVLDGQERDWRGFTREDYRDANLAAFLFTLGAYSKRDKFTTRAPSEPLVLALKLPGLEAGYGSLSDILRKLEVETHFVYCARDPLKSLKSNWQMPWVEEKDAAVFSNQYANELQESLEALDKIPASEVTAWVTPTPENTTPEGLLGGRLSSWVRITNPEPRHIDEWPSERRRLRALPEDVQHDFMKTQSVVEFGRRFGFIGS